MSGTKRVIDHLYAFIPTMHTGELVQLNALCDPKKHLGATTVEQARALWREEVEDLRAVFPGGVKLVEFTRGEVIEEIPPRDPAPEVVHG